MTVSMLTMSWKIDLENKINKKYMTDLDYILENRSRK